MDTPWGQRSVLPCKYNRMPTAPPPSKVNELERQFSVLQYD
jgi:hypothetical protein